MTDTRGAIRFGNWELRPVDARSWELYHLRASTRGFGDGTTRWSSEGRFYSYNTFHLAIQYAADRELKDKVYGNEMKLEDALQKYKAIVDALKADVLASMEVTA